MAEAHSDAYLSRKMTRAEVKELSEDEKRERTLAKKRISTKKYREQNSEKEKERNKKRYAKYPEKFKENTRKWRETNKEKVKGYKKKYREENPEKEKEYNQSPAGKKSNTLSNWKSRGLDETEEEMERLYELWLTQELCSSCECILTRTGNNCSTDACLDHSHVTNRFRQICCRACNHYDNWKKYWVDGIFGGSKLPRPPPQ
jgi:hypothetical protein